MKGVENVISGYSNGLVKNPTYREVCTGRTGCAEVVRIEYDSSQVTYAELLEVFWRIHNPTTLNRQGNDVGTQYRSGIFYETEEQRLLAEASMAAAQESGLWEDPIVTVIEPLRDFSVAEDYHQDYYRQNPNQPYCTFVVGEKVKKFKELFADKQKGL
jgi:peptide-methionine (S)-S-oxide reductase